MTPLNRVIGITACVIGAAINLVMAGGTYAFLDPAPVYWLTMACNVSIAACMAILASVILESPT